MHYEAIGMGIRAVIAVACVIAVFQFMLIPTSVARFRQDMFELRREMFCLMADGRIAPNSVPYVALRNRMNTYIRYAERITFYRLIFLGITLRSLGQQANDRFDVAMGSIKDERVRDALYKYRDDVDTKILLHILRTSVVAIMLTVVLAIVILAVYMIRKAQVNVVKVALTLMRRHIPTENIEVEAELFGDTAVIT